MSPHFWFWLLLSITFALVEILTPGTFYFLWFCFGALCALFVTFFTDNIPLQICVFISTSILSLIGFYSRLKKYLNTKYRGANIEELIGKLGIVIEEIEPLKSTGMVKVNGELWRAKSDTFIPKDTKVRIKKINGNTLIVDIA